jgi:3D (Asp-Asp-Asp) domain-containing protein
VTSSERLGICLLVIVVAFLGLEYKIKNFEPEPVSRALVPEKTDNTPECESEPEKVPDTESENTDNTLARVQESHNDTVIAEVSSYTSRRSETDATPHTTAAGTQTRPGVIACPPHMPFGTNVIIKGVTYVCEDRMNARYHNRNVFDVWKRSVAAARRWGRQRVEVTIVR